MWGQSEFWSQEEISRTGSKLHGCFEHRGKAWALEVAFFVVKHWSLWSTSLFHFSIKPEGQDQGVNAGFSWNINLLLTSHAVV